MYLETEPSMSRNFYKPDPLNFELPSKPRSQAQSNCRSETTKQQSPLQTATHLIAGQPSELHGINFSVFAKLKTRTYWLSAPSCLTVGFEEVSQPQDYHLRLLEYIGEQH